MTRGGPDGFHGIRQEVAGEGVNSSDDVTPAAVLQTHRHDRLSDIRGIRRAGGVRRLDPALATSDHIDVKSRCAGLGFQPVSALMQEDIFSPAIAKETISSRSHRDMRLRASITAAASGEPPRAVGMSFPALSMSSVMTRRICSSDWTTPPASKSLRILLNTSLRWGSTVSLARASE